MSLTLVSHPVYVDDLGNTINIFPGFKPILVEFKREDIVVNTVTQGAGNTALVKVTGDITTALTLLQGVYVYSEGTDYTYDKTGKIIDFSYIGIDNETNITVDIDYIENATGGYLNYLHNYHVEMKLVNPLNDDIDLLGFSIKSDGTPSGVVEIDTSIINDLNDQIFPTVSGEMVETRIKYNVKYRAVYKGTLSASFTLIDSPIIAVFATEDFETDEFLSPYTLPRYYAGYPTGIGIIRSDVADTTGYSLQIFMDQLDINQGAITADEYITDFSYGTYGVLYVNASSYTGTLNTNTRYLKLKSVYDVQTDYDLNDYDSTDYA